MGLLNKIFGYRWSLYIVKNQNELMYAMHENSVLRMVGYVMDYFKNGNEPKESWSLHLNFNKKHESFLLKPEHFTQDGNNITQALIQKIEVIDPNYQVKGSEPIFVNTKTKKKLKLSEPMDLSNL
jgi:hypothetical protein